MTAVEWLVEQLEKQIEKSAKNELGTNRGSDYRIGLRKAIDFCGQAIEMEKKQIVEAHGNKTKKSVGVSNYTYTLTGEQYYNETFKKK
jgi:hypothetical protein